MKIQLRFNTDKERVDASSPAWRVIVDGQEQLAEHVEIHTKTWTTRDEIAPGKFKWHISCEGVPHWDAARKTCVIKPA